MRFSFFTSRLRLRRGKSTASSLAKNGSGSLSKDLRCGLKLLAVLLAAATATTLECLRETVSVSRLFLDNATRRTDVLATLVGGGGGNKSVASVEASAAPVPPPPNTKSSQPFSSSTQKSSSPEYESHSPLLLVSASSVASSLPLSTTPPLSSLSTAIEGVPVPEGGELLRSREPPFCGRSAGEMLSLSRISPVFFWSSRIQAGEEVRALFLGDLLLLMPGSSFRLVFWILWRMVLLLLQSEVDNLLAAIWNLKNKKKCEQDRKSAYRTKQVRDIIVYQTAFAFRLFAFSKV